MHLLLILLHERPVHRFKNTVGAPEGEGKEPSTLPDKAGEAQGATDPFSTEKVVRVAGLSTRCVYCIFVGPLWKRPCALGHTCKCPKPRRGAGPAARGGGRGGANFPGLLLQLCGFLSPPQLWAAAKGSLSH